MVWESLNNKLAEQVGREQLAGRSDFGVFMWLESCGWCRSGVVRPCLTYCVVPNFADRAGYTFHREFHQFSSGHEFHCDIPSCITWGLVNHVGIAVLLLRVFKVVSEVVHVFGDFKEHNKS